MLSQRERRLQELVFGIVIFMFAFVVAGLDAFANTPKIATVEVDTGVPYECGTVSGMTFICYQK